MTPEQAIDRGELSAVAIVANRVCARDSPYSATERLAAICVARRMRRHKAHSDRFVAWPGFKSGTIDTGLKKNVWLNAMKILCGEPVKVRTKAELIPIAERVKGKKYRYTHDTVRRPAIFRRSRRNNGGWLYELIESPKPSVAIPTEKTPQERLDRISDAALRSSIQGHARRLVEHRGIKQGDAINQALALFEPAIRRLETATAAKSV